MSDNDNTEMKVKFAPGCFDSFEGTQEELDAIIAQIIEMARNGEMFENAQDFDPDTLIDDGEEEFVEYVQSRQPRTLQ